MEKSLPYEWENLYDNDVPPLFKFINTQIPGPQVDFKRYNIYDGCDCKNNNELKICSVNCSCIARMGQDCYDTHNSLVCSSFLDNNENHVCQPLFECNSKCCCGPECHNRVVQKGLTLRLQVFKTSHKGWAVRTLEPISQCRFVCEYVGEVINTQQAKQRWSHFYDSLNLNYLLVAKEFM